MNKTQNLTILLLTCSAGVLATLLLLAWPPEGLAGETSVQAGDYILATGSYSESADLIYVVDVAQQKMNLYFLDPRTNGIESVAGMDVAREFEKQAAGD